MRKVVLYTLMSLDGSVDDPGQYFSTEREATPVFDAMMDENESAVIGAQDAVVLGRHMYDEWSGYWPSVHEHPFADFINGVKKHVVTSTPLTRQWDNSEVVAGPLDDFVRDLKARPGGDIGIHGSISLAQSLLQDALVDELRLVVGPAIRFPGRRLFSSTDGIRRLELIGATPTPSGSLLLAYRVPEAAGVRAAPGPS